MAIEEKTSSNQELLAEITKIIGKQVPVEIKNYEAYLEHLKLNNNPIHTIKLQIGEKTMPITHPFPVINKALKKAIELEQIDQDRADKIYNMKRQQQNLKLKAMAKIKQAYGTVVNKHGEVVKNRSLFEPVKVQMIELFGRMFSAPEVHEICLRQWKLTVTLNQVSDFRKQEMIEITKRVEEHKRTYSDIRLGHKRSRLEELVWLYNDRKRKYEISGKGEDHRLLLSTLDQIKKEAEGDLIRIDGSINFGLDQTIESHIQKDLNKTIPIKELVLARVAAKTGVDPISLINFLNKSLYRKVLDAETVDFEEMPQYPSLQNYDFDKIKNINEQSAQEKTLEAKIMKVGLQPQQVNQSEALRQILLRKLSVKVGDLNQEKNNLSENFDTPM